MVIMTTVKLLSPAPMECKQVFLITFKLTDDVKTVSFLNEIDS